jgi:hypothetical protein
MRKTAAHLLLFCFGVYHFGYFAVQFLMPMAIHHHWQSQIWEYEASALGEKLVRIPFPMPYGQDHQDFQPVNFAMEIDGQTSRVIKQRYFDEHLEVIVVEDKLQTNLQHQVKNWLLSFAADAPDSQQPPLQQVLSQSFAKNFIPYEFEMKLEPSPWEIPLRHTSHLLVAIAIGIHDIFLPPPRQFHLS